MKNRSDRIQKIVSLAAADERRVSIAMGQSHQDLRAAMSQLDELSSYRREYAAKQTPGGTADALRWHDYQAFLSRLDLAVKAQQQLILDGEKNLDAHRRRWMAKRQRLDSLQRVLERYRSDERAEADRLTQKRLDDLPKPRDIFDTE